MAKVTIKIDGKNKIFTKKDMTLGIMKKRSEFETKLQNIGGTFEEMQELYRKHRTILNKISKVQEKLENEEDKDKIDEIFDEMEELENTEEYKEFESKAEALREESKDKFSEDFDIHDELAVLLVDVFDQQFTYDEVMNGLTVINGDVIETYAQIFKDNNKSGKSTKKTAKSQTK